MDKKACVQLIVDQKEFRRVHVESGTDRGGEKEVKAKF